MTDEIKETSALQDAIAHGEELQASIQHARQRVMDAERAFAENRKRIEYLQWKEANG